MQGNLQEIPDPIWDKVKKGSVACLGVALLLLLISFGSTHWAATNHHVQRKEHIGLWRFCVHTITPSGYKDACSDFIDITTPDWLKAAQSFMTLALGGVLACIGLFGAYIFVEKFNNNFMVLGACVVATVATIGFYAIGVSTFGARYTEYYALKDPAFTPEVADLDWSFYLAVVSGFLCFVAPIMMLPETILEIQHEARLNMREKRRDYQIARTVPAPKY